MTRIAAIQTSSSDDVRDNLSRIDPLLEQARDAGASVVVLPECFAFMQSSRAQLRETAEADDTGPIQDWCRERAAAHDLWLIAGSLPARSQDPKRVYNSLRVYTPDGAEAARYDKIFLFDVDLESGESFRESDYTVAGDNVLAVSTPAGVIGLSVCYDLRFPELYRRLAAAGAEVLVVPSAFARSTGDAHWMRAGIRYASPKTMTIVVSVLPIPLKRFCRAGQRVAASPRS